MSLTRNITIRPPSAGPRRLHPGEDAYTSQDVYVAQPDPSRPYGDVGHDLDSFYTNAHRR
jgi:hypothetical protein